MKKLFSSFILLTSLFIVGCTNPLGSGGSKIAENYNPGVNSTLTAGSAEESVNQNSSAFSVTLPYTAEGGANPVACSVSSLSNLAETSGCACVAGVCSVGIQSTTNFYGVASFRFQLTDSDGNGSNLGSGAITVRRVTVTAQSGSAQSAVVGTQVSSPLVARVTNSEGTAVSGINVSWSIISGAGSLNTCTTTSDSSGLAQCDFTLGTTAGAHSAQASIFSGQSTAAFSATGTHAAAHRLAFNLQPSGGAAATAWATQPRVLVQDSFGNTVTSSSVSVALAISTNPNSGTLAGTNSVAASSGVATFSGLSIDKSGVGYRLTATSAGLASAVSEAFNVTPGAATQLAIQIQPNGGTAGASWSQQPAIVVQDAQGNTVTSSIANVSLAITTNPGSGTLSGTTTLSAAGGVASFSSLSINKSGTGYVLTASSSGLTSVATTTFNITPSSAAQIAVSAGNSQSATAGASLSSPLQAVVTDAFGNAIGSGTTVTWAVASGGGSVAGCGASTTNASGIASCTPVLGASMGVNSFTATVAGIATPATFVATGTAGAPAAVSISANNNQSATVSFPLPAALVALVEDSNGNAVGSGHSVAWSVTGGGGSVAPCASSITDSNGLARCTPTLGTSAGANSYRATVGASQANFSATATPGTPSAILVYTNDLQTGTAGQALSLPITAVVTDSFSNPVVAGVVVNWAVALGGGSVASCAGSTTNSSGLATCTPTLGTTTGTNTFTAASSGVAGPTTFTATGIAGTPASISIHANNNQNSVVASSPASALQVILRDSNSNAVGAGIAVSWSVTSGGGSVAGCAGSVTNASGVASCTPIVGTAVGANTFSATSAGVSSVNLTVNATPGTATQLAFQTQPSGGTAATSFGTQPSLVIRDAYGNTVTGSTATVALAISTNPGSGTLSGTSSVSATSGVATFANLSINKSGFGYQLTATSAGLASAVSDSFTITPGAATQLSFQTQPNGGTAGSSWSQQPVVLIQDAQGNTVTSSSANVTVAISTNPGSGTLSGTATVAAVNGVATFTGLSINRSSTGYTLAASSGVLTGATSSGFNITPGAATQLAFQTQPGGGVAATSWSQQPVVLIQDAQGNTVTSSSANVTLAISTNPGSGTLSGTATVAAVNDVATFAGLSINKSGTSYTLAATSGVLTGTTSSSFNITHGPASQLVFTTQPSGAVAGVAFTSQPVVAIQDAQGNTVTTGVDAGAFLTMSINSGTGSLSGTVTVMSILGVSTWSGLSIDAFGAKTLLATKPNLLGSGGTGSLTAVSTSFTNSTNPPSVPSGLASVASSASVALSWSASSGATTYNIFRGTSSGALSQIGTSGTNSYTDSTAVNGTTYFYAVQAENSAGTSASSSEIQVRPLSTPSISSIAINDTAGAGALVLTWSASTGATSYTIKYSTTLGNAGTGTTGCTVSAPTVTCNVTGLTPGTTYYFVVNATNANTGSVNSIESSGVPRAAPSLSLTPSHLQIASTFSSAGATSFDLSYGTSTGVYSTTVTGATSGSAVTGLVNGTTYFFRVVANFSNGTLSSVESSSAPNGPQTFNISTAAEGNAQVALTWAASTGATSYTIRYGTSTGSYPTTFATGVTGTSSTVTGLTNGTPYFFMVTAVNASGSQNANAEVTRTPAQPTLALVSNAAYDSTNNQFVTPTMASSWSADLAFTLGGLSSFTCNGNVAATSSNTSLVNNGSLTVSGTYPNCNLNVAIGSGVTGSTTLTLTATHGAATAVSSFTFYVLPASAATFATRKAVLGYSGSAMRVRRSTDNAETDIGFDTFGNLNRVTLNTFLGISTYPLDDMSVGAVAAYSLRKLRAAYTGSAIRVRRSSDNAEQDIGFTSAGDLDQTALLAFVGAGSGFVRTWYDQSGNSRNLIQTTTSSQPRIVNSGAIDTINSKPGFAFTTFPQIMATDFFTGGNSQMTGNAVGLMNNDAANLYGRILSINSSGDSFDWNNSTSALLLCRQNSESNLSQWRNGNARAFGAITLGSGFLATSIFNSTTSQIFVNGTLGTTTSFASPNLGASVKLAVGAHLPSPQVGDQHRGIISEVTYFSSSLSDADRQILEKSQAGYYGITYATALPSAFVRTWYDQSGNVRNATQATTSAQSRIANAGQIDTLPSSSAAPSIRWSDNNMLILDGGSAWANTNTFSAITTYRRDDPAVVNRNLWGNRSASGGRILRTTLTTALYANINASSVGSTTTDATSYVHSVVISGSTQNQWINGGGQVTGGTNNYNASDVSYVIGREGPGTGFHMIGYIGEISLFDVALTSAERVAAQRGQGLHYGIIVP